MGVNQGVAGVGDRITGLQPFMLAGAAHLHVGEQFQVALQPLAVVGVDWTEAGYRDRLAASVGKGNT